MTLTPEQIYKNALIALMTNLTTKNDLGIIWEDEKNPIAIKKLKKDTYVITDLKTLTITHYYRNIKHGLQIYRTTSKKTWYEVEYKNGKINGNITFYYPSGKMYKKTPYQNNKRDGIEYIWDEEGNEIGKLYFVDDTIISTKDSKYC